MINAITYGIITAIHKTRRVRHIGDKAGSYSNRWDSTNISSIVIQQCA